MEERSKRAKGTNCGIVLQKGLFYFASIAAIALVVSACGGSGSGGSPGESYSVTLYWEAPAQNVDGSPVLDLAGYKIYDGPASGDYRGVTDVGNVTEFTLDSLPAGTSYIAVAAYDSSGNQSDQSNEVSVTLP